MLRYICIFAKRQTPNAASTPACHKIVITPTNTLFRQYQQVPTRRVINNEFIKHTTLTASDTTSTPCYRDNTRYHTVKQAQTLMQYLPELNDIPPLPPNVRVLIFWYRWIEQKTPVPQLYVVKSALCNIITIWICLKSHNGNNSRGCQSYRTVNGVNTAVKIICKLTSKDRLFVTELQR